MTTFYSSNKEHWEFLHCKISCGQTVMLVSFATPAGPFKQTCFVSTVDTWILTHMKYTIRSGWIRSTSFSRVIRHTFTCRIRCLSQIIVPCGFWLERTSNCVSLTSGWPDFMKSMSLQRYREIYVTAAVVELASFEVSKASKDVSKRTCLQLLVILPGFTGHQVHGQPSSAHLAPPGLPQPLLS